MKKLLLILLLFPATLWAQGGHIVPFVKTDSVLQLNGGAVLLFADSNIYIRKPGGTLHNLDSVGAAGAPSDSSRAAYIADTAKSVDWADVANAPAIGDSVRAAWKADSAGKADTARSAGTVPWSGVTAAPDSFRASHIADTAKSVDYADVANHPVFLIPADTGTFRGVSDASYQALGTYLIPADTGTFRGVSDAYYLNAAAIDTSTVLFWSDTTLANGPVTNYDLTQIPLNQIINPTADKTFVMAGRDIGFTFTTGGSADGHFELEASGNMSGDIFHVHQHVGNPPAGTGLIHAEADDVDVIPLRVVGVNDTNSVFIGGKVFADSLAVAGGAIIGSSTGTVRATSGRLSYTASDTVGLGASLALKAPLASPTFTGTVTTPLGAGTVRSSAGGVLSSTASDTVGLAAALFAKAPLADPTFTTKATSPYFVSSVGTGTAPYQATSTTLNTNLNADLLDGYNTNMAASNSTVVVRNANGYVFANYFNTSSSASATPATKVFSSQDTYIRSRTNAEHVSDMGMKDTVIKAIGFYGLTAADSAYIFEVPAGAASWTVKSIRAIRVGGTAATMYVRNVTDANAVCSNYTFTTSMAAATLTANVTLSASDLIRVVILTATGTPPELFVQITFEKPQY